MRMGVPRVPTRGRERRGGGSGSGESRYDLRMERTAEGATPPWYAAGLRFDCGRCGNCCSGPSGRVWFDREELLAMARFLGELPFEFRRKFTRSLDGRD